MPVSRISFLSWQSQKLLFPPKLQFIKHFEIHTNEIFFAESGSYLWQADRQDSMKCYVGDKFPSLHRLTEFICT